MRPLIGITTYNSTTMLADVETSSTMLPSVYVAAVRRAGGCPVLLPAGGDYEEAADTIASLDGILLPGGPDIGPQAYGQPRHLRTQPPDTARDEWEHIIIQQALLLNIPLLGICRGMQLINVALGGTLHQHISSYRRHEPDGPGFMLHQVAIEDGSKLAKIMTGTPLADVPARHHQAVDVFGRGLRPVAWADDWTVEAVEGAEPGRFLLGVQWHPERDKDQRLFTALAEAAAVARIEADG